MFDRCQHAITGELLSPEFKEIVKLGKEDQARGYFNWNKLNRPGLSVLSIILNKIDTVRATSCKLPDDHFQVNISEWRFVGRHLAENFKVETANQTYLIPSTE